VIFIDRCIKRKFLLLELDYCKILCKVILFCSSWYKSNTCILFSPSYKFYNMFFIFIIKSKGIIRRTYIIIIQWFLSWSSNFLFPFSLIFVGEIIMIIVLLGWSIILLIIIVLSWFHRGACSLHLYSSVRHGEINVTKNGHDYDYVSEIFIINITLLLPLLILTLKLFVICYMLLYVIR